MCCYGYLQSSPSLCPQKEERDEDGNRWNTWEEITRAGTGSEEKRQTEAAQSQRKSEQSFGLKGGDWFCASAPVNNSCCRGMADGKNKLIIKCTGKLWKPKTRRDMSTTYQLKRGNAAIFLQLSPWPYQISSVSLIGGTSSAGSDTSHGAAATCTFSQMAAQTGTEVTDGSWHRDPDPSPLPTPLPPKSSDTVCGETHLCTDTHSQNVVPV